MVVENILYRQMSEAELEKQTCAEKEDTSHEVAKDYFPYSVFVAVYSAAFVLLFVLFFDPEMKRSNVDTSVRQCDKVNVSDAKTESQVLVCNDVD